MDNQTLKTLLDQKREASDMPAVGAAVVRPAGIEAIAVSGVRQVDKASAVTAKDAWHIGSNTKAMTAALYARLVDQRRAKWNATLESLFPSLRSIMDDAWRDITIEQLLSHRAGMDDVAGYGQLLSSRNDMRPIAAQRLELAATKLSKPPPKTVGEIAYSNFGYIIAGSAIENIIGKCWEDGLRRELFDPLQMHGADFGVPQGEAPQGHYPTGAGERLRALGNAAEADNPRILGPAGTVHLSLPAWAQFVRVFIDPNQTFLRKESLVHLIAPVSGDPYALGWGVSDDPLSGRLLWHGGSNKSWLAKVLIVRDYRVAFLVTTNCATPAAQTSTMEIISELKQVLARPAIH